MKRILLLLLLLMLAMVTVACGADIEESNDYATEEVQDEVEEETEEPVAEIKVDHDLGTTIVPVNPEKVVVFDFGTLDTLNTLGVEIAALPKGNMPSYLAEFESDEYENAGTLFEPDFETLAVLDPDLIIISGRTSEMYEELSELAPTIFMGIDRERYFESFEENVTLLSEIFNKHQEATDALEDIQAKKEALTSSAPQDKEGLILLTTNGGINAYGPGSRYGIIHDDFNIIPVDENIEVSNHGMNVSFEYVAEMNPDYIFVIDRDAATGGEAEAATILDNDLINQTNAAQDNNIIHLTPDFWYLSGGGLVSVSEMIDEIEKGIQ